MRCDAERSLTIPSGMDPVAMKLQRDRKLCAVPDLLTNALKCSYFHPEGPAPDPLGNLDTAEKNVDSKRLMELDTGTLCELGTSLTRTGCFAANLSTTSAEAGPRPGLINSLAARDNSPHLTNLRAALWRFCKESDDLLEELADKDVFRHRS